MSRFFPVNHAVSILKSGLGNNRSINYLPNPLLRVPDSGPFAPFRYSLFLSPTLPRLLAETSLNIPTSGMPIARLSPAGKTKGRAPSQRNQTCPRWRSPPTTGITLPGQAGPVIPTGLPAKEIPRNSSQPPCQFPVHHTVTQNDPRTIVTTFPI